MMTACHCWSRAASAAGFDDLPDRAVLVIAQHVEFRERCAHASSAPHVHRVVLHMTVARCRVTCPLV